MKKTVVNRGRRGFLQGSLLAGAASIAPPALPAAAAQGSNRSSVEQPSMAHAQNETGPMPSVPENEAQIRDPGSDFMVDLLKAAGTKYVVAMPGSTFRGLQESIVNYGGNKSPEFIVCVHEEVSAAMCHGYAKASGQPIACLVHSNVGLQHASMAIYNAYCDRAPMMVLAGNGLDAATRRPGVEWTHTVADLGAMVRDFVKWDDTPVSLQHYAESFMRAHEMSITPPYAPVMIVVDSDLQEHPVAERSRLRIPRRAEVSPPAGDQRAVARAAAVLLDAKAPVIMADRAARTPSGMASVVELAELLNAPVVDKGGRLNMPTNHYLNHSFRQAALISRADVILGLELTDIWGVVNSLADLPERVARPLVGPDVAVISISANSGSAKSNVQDLQRYYAANLTIAGDAEATLPDLIAEIRRLMQPAHHAQIAAREAPARAAFVEMRAAAAREAALSWDASPIGTGRLCMELWDLIKDLDWALVTSGWSVSNWPSRLWDITEHHQFIGGEGGYGVGYNAPAAAGAALAHRDAGRIPVAIQSDGDLMVLPGTLWTLAHHQIPLLSVVHNNRAWHQETMHLTRIANRRNRGVDTWNVGTLLDNPAIDFAQMARSMGVWAEGPVTRPQQLRPALSRALEVVKAGKPALVDVVSQPR